MYGNNERGSERSSNQDKTTKLFVGNLSSRVTKDDLQRLFSTFGKVNEVILKDKEGTNFFAFVDFEDVRDAETALSKLNTTEFMGRDLRVGTANRRRDDDFRGGGERGSRDYANRPPRRCYTCGSLNHISTYCDQNKDGDRGRGDRGGDRGGERMSRDYNNRDQYRDRRDRKRSGSSEEPKPRKRQQDSKSRSRSRDYQRRDRDNERRDRDNQRRDAPSFRGRGDYERKDRRDRDKSNSRSSRN